MMILIASCECSQLCMLSAALVATLSLTIWSFHKVEPLAALLLLPYLAWVIFATFLNSTLINLNPQVETHSCPGGLG